MKSNNELITEKAIELIALINQTRPPTTLYQLRSNGLVLTVKKDDRKRRKNNG